MDMTPKRWNQTYAYLREVFGSQDEHLAGLMGRAIRAGLPDIAVTPEVGRLLMILTGLSGPDGRGGRLAIEVGTLAGYSGIWIARGLGPGGRLVTIEAEALHADFAERSFADAGVGDRVEVVRGLALEALPTLGERFGPASVDLVYLDAVKTEYADYFRLVSPLIRAGGLLVADNALGTGSTCVPEDPGATEATRAIDRFNRLVAGDPAFEAACVPIREGVLIARKRG